MCVTKMISKIFLATYLILVGLATMGEVTMTPMATGIAQFLAVAAGVLILISVGKCPKGKK